MYYMQRDFYFKCANEEMRSEKISDLSEDTQIIIGRLKLESRFSRPRHSALSKVKRLSVDR